MIYQVTAWPSIFCGTPTYGNELADKLAKEAASSNVAETAYNKIPKSAVVRELKKAGELEWQSE
jgi:hypothetical protein